MTTPARRKTSKVVTMPTVESNSQAANRSADVTDRDVAHRAFELYCERGCRDGHDLDDCGKQSAHYEME